MSELSWYRSLYWRIAVGFVALLATLLLLQGTVFLWMTGRMSDLFPNRSPSQFATAMAGEIAAAVADQPGVDVSEYVNSRYARSSRGFVVAMTDGRVIVSQRIPPPPRLIGVARGRLFGDRRFDGRGSMPSFGGDAAHGRDDRDGRDERNGRDDRGGTPARNGTSVSPDRTFRGRPPDRGGFGGFGGGPQAEIASITVDGAVIGVVAVPREPPPLTVALRDLGPTLASVALVLLVIGTAIAALLIVRPTRRRLQQLQDAARAIGAGAAGVRAPESGGDEVTALSRAFNEMAGQLEQRTEALEAADRTRRQLLADVSHELMTPLAAILGYVETLRMGDIDLDEATRTRYLRIVNDEADRLEHIVGDLLDLARLEGGGGSLRMEPVRIAYLLERVRHRHAPSVAEKHITLTTAQEPIDGVLIGDQNRLEQALQNLVANAVRHTPSGGAVTVAAIAAGSEVILRVDDTGPGIPDDQLPRVFERFYKVDESRTGTEQPSGSGLGLSIVQAIVVRHGGRVTASNVPGGGARFEITLPLSPAERPPASV
jgi:signal transduction histidine kinase